MLTSSVAEIEARAQGVARALREGGLETQVRASKASVGGGAFPTAEIPSTAIVVAGNPEEVEEKLRRGEPPVIARIAEGSLLLDLRSVQAREDGTLSRAVLAALS